jgi:hypothetical protein
MLRSVGRAAAPLISWGIIESDRLVISGSSVAWYSVNSRVSLIKHHALKDLMGHVILNLDARPRRLIASRCGHVTPWKRDPPIHL